MFLDELGVRRSSKLVAYSTGPHPITTLALRAGVA